MTHLRIKELGESQGLKIKTLADRAGLPWSMVAPLWKDTAQRYDRNTLDKIAAALGVSVADLFAGEPEPQTDK